MELFSIFQHLVLVLQQQLYSFGSVSPLPSALFSGISAKKEPFLHTQCSGWAVNQLLLAPWRAVVCLVHLFVLCYFIGDQKDIWVVILDIQYWWKCCCNPAAMLSTRWRWIQESIYQSQVFLYRVKGEENYRYCKRKINICHVLMIPQM